MCLQYMPFLIRLNLEKNQIKDLKAFVKDPVKD